MKASVVLTLLLCSIAVVPVVAQPSKQAAKNLYLDVHHLGAGKVTYRAVADAHARDLATQDRYHVQFHQYWVDEASGTVYCLSSAPDSQAIHDTHVAAHGMSPDQVFQVTDGEASAL